MSSYNKDIFQNHHEIFDPEVKILLCKWKNVPKKVHPNTLNNFNVQ